MVLPFILMTLPKENTTEPLDELLIHSINLESFVRNFVFRDKLLIAFLNAPLHAVPIEDVALIEE